MAADPIKSNVVVFYPQVAEQFTINRNWSCRSNEPENAWKEPYLIQPATVESIEKALANGPIPALAAVGPRYYSVLPKKLTGQLPGHLDVPVYGWAKGAERISNYVQYQPMIICGVQRREQTEHLYYLLAEDTSLDPEQAIGEFKPLSTDKKVYVTSMQTFAKYEFDLFPPVSKGEIEKYQSQSVVPTVLAGQSHLLKLWKEGELTIRVLTPHSNSN